MVLCCGGRQIREAAYDKGGLHDLEERALVAEAENSELRARVLDLEEASNLLLPPIPAVNTPGRPHSSPVARSNGPHGAPVAPPPPPALPAPIRGAGRQQEATQQPPQSRAPVKVEPHPGDVTMDPALNARLNRLESMQREQHQVWVDKVRPALAWIIDRLGEVHGAVGTGPAPSPPPRTPGDRYTRPEPEPEARTELRTHGGEWWEQGDGPVDESKMSTELAIARRRLRDSTQTFTPEAWAQRLDKFALPSSPGPGAVMVLPFREFERALRVRFGNGTTGVTSGLIDDVKLEPVDAELVYRAVEIASSAGGQGASSHEGGVRLVELAKFLGGALEGAEVAAATKIQSMHRGKRSRRRVNAKFATALVDSVQVSEAVGLERDERWQSLAALPPSEILEAVFRKIDDNNSGAVTRRELRYSTFGGSLKAHWKVLNRNDDKKVSLTEWEEFWGALYEELEAEPGAYAQLVVDTAWQGLLDPAKDFKQNLTAQKVAATAPAASRSGSPPPSPKKGGKAKKKGGKPKKKGLKLAP